MGWNEELKEFLNKNDLVYTTNYEGEYLVYPYERGIVVSILAKDDSLESYFLIEINSTTIELQKYIKKVNNQNSLEFTLTFDGIVVSHKNTLVLDKFFELSSTKLKKIFNHYDMIAAILKENKILEDINNLDKVASITKEELEKKKSDNNQDVDSKKQKNTLSKQVTIENKKEENMQYSDIKKELDNIIGLDLVKEHLKELENKILTDKHRKKMDLKVNTRSMHTLFLGNPGTGKTTVARLFGNILKNYGVLEKGHIVEVSRKDLVGQHLGHTAPKTNEKIEEAFGGILFIDEAYTLQQDERDVFGNEAIDTILKAMEDYRDKFIVIGAGYPKPMEKFINANPGLKSRFNEQFTFSDYSSDELMKISKLMLKDMDYILSADANVNLKRLFDKLLETKDDKFGNARVARNIIEDTVQNQNSRIADIIRDNNGENIKRNVLMEIYSIDIDTKKFKENS